MPLCQTYCGPSARIACALHATACNRHMGSRVGHQAAARAAGPRGSPRVRKGLRLHTGGVAVVACLAMLAMAGPAAPASAARKPVEFEVLGASGSSTTMTTANQPATTGQHQYSGGAQASWRLSSSSRGTVVALGSSAPFNLDFTGEEHGSWMECELGVCSPMSCTMTQGPRAVAGLSLMHSQNGDVVATLTIPILVGCGVPSDEGLVLAT